MAIFNSTQNYYINAFEKYAASTIATGALFRSVIGGAIPSFTLSLFDNFGVGWGMSVFAFVGLVLAPNRLLFFYFNERLREKFTIDLDKV